MATAVTAVGDLFAPKERAKWTGLLMAIFGFSSVIGPTLGGWMVDHMNWEWIFWIFLPLGLLSFILILRMFPKTSRNTNERLDIWGSTFLTLAIIPLLLGFTWQVRLIHGVPGKLLAYLRLPPYPLSFSL